jgi:hypothetical protein
VRRAAVAPVTPTLPELPEGVATITNPGQISVGALDIQVARVQARGRRREATMTEHENPAIPDDVRDGDVLVYMSGRLLVVDHLVPEAYAIDLCELEAEPEATARREDQEPTTSR